MRQLVGHEEYSAFGPEQPESTAWIGKPWRRIELLTQRVFYKGEEIDRTRTLSFHLGLQRLGIAFTFIVTKAVVLDYDEERQ